MPNKSHYVRLYLLFFSLLVHNYDDQHLKKEKQYDSPYSQEIAELAAERYLKCPNPN